MKRQLQKETPVLYGKDANRFLRELTANESRDHRAEYSRAKATFKRWGRRQKYNAQRSTSTLLNGKTFPSRLERDVANELSLLERAGIIKNLRFQQSVQVGPDTRWRIDFSYEEKGRTIYHEAKGFEDQMYRHKKKLYAKYRTEELRISKRVHGGSNRCGVVEVINPALR